MEKGLMVLAGMLEVLLVAAVPALAQGGSPEGGRRKIRSWRKEQPPKRSLRTVSRPAHHQTGPRRFRLSSRSRKIPRRHGVLGFRACRGRAEGAADRSGW